jgi:hypothetical protein
MDYSGRGITVTNALAYCISLIAVEKSLIGQVPEKEIKP